MKKIKFALFVTLICTMSLMAQSSESTPMPNIGWGLGFDISGMRGDLGVGLNVTTPTFFKDEFWLRARYVSMDCRGGQYMLGMGVILGMAGPVRLSFDPEV